MPNPDLSNLTPTLISVTREVLKEMPKNYVFQEFLAGKEPELNEMGRQAIASIIAVPDTPLMEESYQKAYIDKFTAHFAVVDDRAGFQGRVNELLPDKNGKFTAEGQYLIYETANIVGQALEKHHLSRVIQAQSTVNSPERTKQLKSSLNNNRLILAQGRDGQYNILITQTELSQAAQNPRARQALLQRLSGKIQTFNQLPRRQNVPQNQRNLLPVVAKVGTQVTATALANLQAQMIMKQALQHYDYLRQQGFAAATQMSVNLQTQNISAQLIDQAGRRLLMRMNLLANQAAQSPAYNFTFLEGPNNGQTMTLTPEELEKYRQLGLTADQMFQEVSKQRTAEQAEDAKRRQIAEQARRAQLQDEAANIAAATAPNQAVGDATAVDAADEAAQPGLDIRVRPPKPTIVTTTTVQVPQPSKPQSVRRTVRQLQDSRINVRTPVVGALDAKKQRLLRKQKFQTRAGTTKQKGRGAGPAQIQIPAQLQQQVTTPGPKVRRPGTMTGLLFGGGITGLFAGTSLFDIFF